VDQFMSVCDAYIVEGQPKTLNISGKDRKVILEVYKVCKDAKVWKHRQAPLLILDDARKTALNDLKFDSFPRFMYSDPGYDIIVSNSWNESVISQSPLYVIIDKIKDSALAQEHPDEEELSQFAASLSTKGNLKSLLNGDEFTKEENGTFVIRYIVYDNFKKKKYKKSGGSGSGLKGFLSKIVKDKEPEEKFREAYRVALQIGPYILEWDENSIVVPAKVATRPIVLALDIVEPISVLKYDELVGKMIDVILHWNVNMNYRPWPENQKVSGNSDNFVMSLLAKTGLRLVMPPNMKSFVDSLRTRDPSHPFSVDIFVQFDFQKKAEMVSPYITITDHAQLDDIVKRALVKDPNVAKNNRAEWDFLRALDRGFYMNTEFYTNALKDESVSKKHGDSYNKKLNQCKPSSKECPFKDFHK